MVLLLRDFPLDGAIIPFTESSLVLLGSIFILSPGVFLDSILVYALANQRDIPVNVINLYYDGWAVGLLACRWETVLIIYFLGMSIVSVLLITLHRLLVVVFRKQISSQNALIMIGSSWVVLGVIVTVFTLADPTGTLVGLQSNHLFRYVAMSSTQPLNMIASVTIFLIISGTIIFVCVAYYSIVSKYVKAKREMEMQANASINSKPQVLLSGKQVQKKKSQSKASASERKLIIKSVAISAAFAFCWVFYAFLVLYEVVTHEEVATVYNNFCDYVSCSFPTVNFFILYRFDGKVRQNIRELLRMDKIEGYVGKILGGVSSSMKIVIERQKSFRSGNSNLSSKPTIATLDSKAEGILIMRPAGDLDTR